MSEIDNVKSEAYLVCEEWGPDMRIPREKRLADLFPQISDDERAKWLEEFARIDSVISGVVNEGLATTYSGEAFAELLRKDFPFMNDAAVSKAHFLANYYQWHG